MTSWRLYAVGVSSSRREGSLFLGRLPISSCAGGRLTPSSGVVPLSKRASCLSVAFLQRRFTVCTALLTSPLALGKWGLEVLWAMPYSLQNLAKSCKILAKSLEANCGPPSLQVTSGMPCRQNCAFSTSVVSLLPRS